MYLIKSLKEYLEDLAAKLPAPGGGSAAALVGALGVALLEMVANFTIGKEKYKASEEEITRVQSACQKIREELTRLIDEDVAVYKNVSKAFSGKEQGVIQAALKDAASVPMGVCNLCHEAIGYCHVLLEKGNVKLASDVGVAASFLASAFESALLNVEINLASIKDKEFLAQAKKALGPQEALVKATHRQVMEDTKKIMTN